MSIFETLPWWLPLVLSYFMATRTPNIRRVLTHVGLPVSIATVFLALVFDFMGERVVSHRWAGMIDLSPRLFWLVFAAIMWVLIMISALLGFWGFKGRAIDR